MNWLEPTTEMIKHKYVVVFYEYIDCTDEIAKNVDVFYFNGLSNVFVSNNNYTKIKYKDVLKWFPLPNVEE